MEVFKRYQEAPQGASYAVALGNFDGIHLGHRSLIQKAIALSSQSEVLLPAIFTFSPHPAAFFSPENAPLLLTSQRQKLELLESLGVRRTIVQQFDEKFAQLSAEDFASEVLPAVGATHVIAGDDFHFGKGRTGNIDTLRRWGEKLGYEVHQIPSIECSDGKRISSSRIRTLLANGDVGGAKKLLARAHSATGVVVRGKQRGRDIGFPTANIETSNLLPCNGIYAVQLDYGGRIYQGAASLGFNPTFDDVDKQSLEVYIFEFAEDIYDQTVTVRFEHFLRHEKKFDSVEQLINQIKNDELQARELLSKTKETP